MRKQGDYIKERRFKFKKGLQRKFIKKIKKRSEMSWSQLAKKFDISEHTIKWDLYKEKSTMPFSIVKKMLKIYPIKDLEEIKRNWVEKILEPKWGQIKAGGKNIKKIRVPKKSEELAEFIGIILGDGHIERKGIRVIGNSIEKNHYNYIKTLITKLFGPTARIYISYTKDTVVILNVYSKKLVEYLKSMGLKVGNKINNKTAFPRWIFKNKKFVYGALRGLFDTDGGIYSEQKNYKRELIEFQTHSFTIRKNIYELVKKAGFTPSKSSLNVRVQNQEEIHKFFKLVGSSNPKNIVRYKEFIIKNHIPSKEELTTKILDHKGPIPFKMQP